MSNATTSGLGLTRPRVQRACDQCRQRKAKCDGSGVVNKKCSSCSGYGRECTYTNFKRQGARRSEKITPEYVEELENTIEKLKKLLVTVKNSSYDATPEEEPSPDPTISEGHLVNPSDVFSSILRNMEQRLDPSTWSDEEEGVYVPVQGNNSVLFGMSSSAHLAKEIMEMKNEREKDDLRSTPASFPTLEPEVWMASSTTDTTFTIDLPDTGVLLHLVDVYFERVNIFWPCIHRPSFEKQLVEGVHLVSPIIGAKLLMVIAIGCQYSPNYKLYWDARNPHKSLSWKWFLKAQQIRRRLGLTLPSLSLDELQFECLMSFFLGGYLLGHTGWIICGIGLRFIMCAGAHKRSKYIHASPFESELSKRVVWIYTLSDIIWSSALGRNPMQIITDLGQVIECDDEYCLENDPSGKTFYQPPGQPSKLAYFNRMIPLIRILEVILNTIYSAKFLKTKLGMDVTQFDEHLVRELDSTMNKWMDAMPVHLRWDPNIQDGAFFTQSALLHCMFYLVQILIHQPYITPNPKRSLADSEPLPSLSICLNAARACCGIAEAHMNRAEFLTPQIQFAVFTSALIILTSIYRKKKSGASINTAKEMGDVKRCIAILENSGERWAFSLRMSQVLRELGSIGIPTQAQGEDKPCFFQTSQTSLPAHLSSEVDVDTILSQSWGNIAGDWDIFSIPGTRTFVSDPAVGPSDPLGANFGQNISYDIFWQNAGLPTFDGMAEPFLGDNLTDSFNFGRGP